MLMVILTVCMGPCVQLRSSSGLCRGLVTVFWPVAAVLSVSLKVEEKKKKSRTQWWHWSNLCVCDKQEQTGCNPSSASALHTQQQCQPHDHLRIYWISSHPSRRSEFFSEISGILILTMFIWQWLSVLHSGNVQVTLSFYQLNTNNFKSSV